MKELESNDLVDIDNYNFMFITFGKKYKVPVIYDTADSYIVSSVINDGIVNVVMDMLSGEYVEKGKITTTNGISTLANKDTVFGNCKIKELDDFEKELSEGTEIDLETIVSTFIISKKDPIVLIGEKEYLVLGIKITEYPHREGNETGVVQLISMVVKVENELRLIGYNLFLNGFKPSKIKPLETNSDVIPSISKLYSDITGIEPSKITKLI